MYENAINEIKEKNLSWIRVYKNACKEEIKRGFYTEYYADKGNGEFVRLTGYIRGFREMSVTEARELEETRIRYFLIYTNSSVVKEKETIPILYQHTSDIIKDKDNEKTIESYNEFYIGQPWEFKGVVITKHEAQEIVKNLFLQELDRLEFKNNQITASIMQPALANLKVEKLDNLNLEVDDLPYK